ncbi:MAG TPA: phosphatase PAP2 family protein [Acidobacteriaceae bacterium]|jgi:membrane-associated phospholipid phosphatase
MRSQVARSGHSARFRAILFVAMAGCCGHTSLASSSVLLTQSNPTATIADVDALPDAPSAIGSTAGNTADVPLEQESHPGVTIKRAPLDVARNGVNIFASPTYLRKRDLKWVLPVAAGTAVAFATDTHTMTSVVSTNPSFNQTAVNVSNGLVDGLIAAPVALFGIGQLRHEERPRETGILGGEAMVGAFVVGQVVKLCTFRERPSADGAQGEFYTGSAGADSSFVSTHSLVAWSSAAVIAGEYPSKWVQLGVYTAAAGVSASRVLGREHFPSDVLLGAAGGWLIGHYVFRAHHHLPLEHASRKRSNAASQQVALEAGIH